jgi:dephospho-CoA kinase
MIIIGLTGSIGMGKTTVARQFARMGAAVCDSDGIVHRLLGPKGRAVEKVAMLFPATRKGNAIDRVQLGREVFGNGQKLKMLEAIVHPLVREEQQRFIRIARLRGKRVVILDIPLLFETGAEQRCDYTVVVIAPAFLQQQRVLKRPHMSIEKLARIRARQMPDYEKRNHADFVIPTGLGKYASRKKVADILRRVLTPTMPVL